MTSLFPTINSEKFDNNTEKFDNKPVGVAYGGCSDEREISLQTGKAIVQGLREYGHDVSEYDLPRDLQKLREDRPAALFLALHGGFGENGTVQGWLEMERIPYTGSRVAASSLAMDKYRAKAVLRSALIPVPDGGFVPARVFATLKKLNIEEAIDIVDTELSLTAPLQFPLVLKRNSAGSSFDVYLNKNPEEYKANLLKLIQKVDPDNPCDGVLVEAYIEGAEYSVGFFEGTFLGAVRIKPANEFYDLESKYMSGGGTGYETVQEGELSKKLETLGRAAYRALGCSGIARIDIIGTKNNLHVLEANTIPGMTPSSLVPKMAQELGIEFPDFVNLILCSARLGERQ